MVHTPNLKMLWRIMRDAGRDWSNDNASSMGAALAFYSLLSLGPLLLIIIAIAGLAYGQEAASGRIFAELRGLFGDEGAAAIQAIIANSRNKDESFLATIIGLVILLITATGVFAQLQDALNIIWKVKPPTGHGVWRLIKARFLSFSLLLGIGFLMLVSLVISAGLTAFSGYFSAVMPPLFLHAMNVAVSFGVITVLFAMMFKILPDIYIPWRDVWVGAAMTAVLFTLGKHLIGLYLGHSGFSSTYGAAGSLIVVLVWVYYSSQIVFFGAEFTQTYARYIETKHKTLA